MKKSGFFWVSYGDLMTSLFFVMLVLYVISFTILQSKQSELQAAADQLKKLEDIQLALEGLDENYFKFDRVNKRYKLQVTTSFKPSSSNIINIRKPLRQKLFNAGKILYAKVEQVIKENPTVDYCNGVLETRIVLSRKYIELKGQQLLKFNLEWNLLF